VVSKGGRVGALRGGGVVHAVSLKPVGFGRKCDRQSECECEALVWLLE